jgi:hypothetical protein
MNGKSDQDIKSFVARALLAILAGKVTELARPTMRGARQFRYDERETPDLMLIETRTGNPVNYTSAYLLYGNSDEEHQKDEPIWRLTLDIVWDDAELLLHGLNLPDAQAFYDKARSDGYAKGIVAKIPKLNKGTYTFEDTANPEVSGFSGEHIVCFRNGKTSHTICTATFYGGRYRPS